MPFNGRSVTEITHQVAHVHPLPARQINWALPLELEEILNKCLAKDPAQRYASAAQLAADLAGLREGRFGIPSPANPARELATLSSHSPA
jgi:serine/threonine protein kinase